MSGRLNNAIQACVTFFYSSASIAWGEDALLFPLHINEVSLIYLLRSCFTLPFRQWQEQWNDDQRMDFDHGVPCGLHC